MRHDLTVLLEHVIPARLIEHNTAPIGIGCLFDDGHFDLILPSEADGS